MHPVFVAAWSSWPYLFLYSDLESKSFESAGTVSLRMDERHFPLGEKSQKLIWNPETNILDIACTDKHNYTYRSTLNSMLANTDEF